MEDLIVQLTGWGCGFGALGVGILVFVTVAKQFLFIGRPNELLVFSGRDRKLADGSTIGYREIFGGRAWRVPLLEKVDRMDLTTIPIDIRVTNCYSHGGIPLNVHAVANVRVASNPRYSKNAIERFLERDPKEIHRVAKETMEGHLRGVLATLTPEEVNEDRLKFSTRLEEEAQDDFNKLGLELDTLKVQNVSDDVNYLDSIGRKRIAEVIRDAEVAESTAKSGAEQAEAASKQAGDVAVQLAETAIVQKTNALRELKAQLEAEARSEEEKAEAEAERSRAHAEAELQEIRARVEKLRLEADVVLPADAAQRARELSARGAAASIEESGRAMATVLELMTQTWLNAGPDAKDIFLIQQLEEVLKTVVARVYGMQLGDVTLLDSGDGQALPRHVASFPATVRQVLDELRASTGVDVTGILSGVHPVSKEVK